MFDTEARRPYIALCRELRLEREFKEGDYVWLPKSPAVLPSRGDEVLLVDGDRVAPWQAPDEGWIWLPRSDQLDDMLEEVHVEDVALRRDPSTGQWGAGDTPSCDWDGGLQWLVDPIYAPTREEAKLRLLCAVTGRVVGTVESTRTST